MASSQRKRELKEQAEQQVLASVANIPPDELLPMPVRDGSTSCPAAERIEYEERKRRHAALFPEYARRWHRPTRKTAELVWETWMTGEPCDLVQAQAVVVIWGVGVQAALAGKLLTVNSVFDALASRWSEHYRACVDDRRASISYDMHADTIKCAHRDLVRNYLSLDRLWRLALKNPFITVERTTSGGYTATPAGQFGRFVSIVEDDPDLGWRRPGLRLLVDQDETPALKDRAEHAAEFAYNQVKSGDRAKRVMRLMQDVRMVFDVAAFLEDYEPIVDEAAALREKIAAVGVDADASDYRREFVLKQGPHAGKTRQTVSDRMQQVRDAVPFDSPGWRDRRREIYALLDKYDSLRARIRQYRGVRDEAVMIKDQVLRRDSWAQPVARIKTAVQRDVNRRFSAISFWPSATRTAIETKTMMALHYDEDGREQEVGYTEHTAERGRWFQFVEGDIYGLDVSSSQSQIIAALTGSDNLAQVAGSDDPPLKEYLARLAWESGVCPAGFTGPKDERLIRFMKTLWLRVGYGSEVRQVLMDTREEPDEYGPTWIERDDNGHLLVKEAADRACSVLQEAPGFDDVNAFLNACQRVGQVADKYEGVILTDPFDGQEVRWNPVERHKEKPVSVGDKRKIITRPPAGLAKPDHPDKGDYPIDRRDLTQKVGPCLVHMCDAFFSGLVIEGLARRGVKSFYAVHDLWAVPADRPDVRQAMRAALEEAGEPWPRDLGPVPDLLLPYSQRALHDAIEEAGEPWLRGLGPVYERLEYYLSRDPDPKWGEYARWLRAKWEDRLVRQDWPRFAVKPAQLTRGDTELHCSYTKPWAR